MVLYKLHSNSNSNDTVVCGISRQHLTLYLVLPTESTVVKKAIMNDIPSKFSCLPMYDLSEISQSRKAHEHFYSLIYEEYANFVDALNDVHFTIPKELAKSGESSEPLSNRGESGSLFLGQTCGLPVLYYRKAFRIIAIPHYKTPGCEGHFYSSVIVTNNSNLMSLSDIEKSLDRENYIIAVNSRTSCSGCLLLASTFGKSFMKNVSNNIYYTGSHINSIEAVRKYKADFASIDCVTYGILKNNRPDLLESIRVIGSTVSAPALPYGI